MVNDRLRAPRVKRHIQRCNHQITGHALPERPTHHLAAVHIYHHGQVQKTGPGGHIGHIGHPQLIDTRGRELTLHQIWRCLCLRVSVRGHHKAPSPAHATQFGLAHQPFNSLVIDTQTHVAQLSLHTGTPVGAIAHNVDLSNALRHDSVIDAALTGWA